MHDEPNRSTTVLSLTDEQMEMVCVGHLRETVKSLRWCAEHLEELADNYDGVRRDAPSFMKRVRDDFALLEKLGYVE